MSIGRDVLGGSDTGAGTNISESGRLGNVTISGSMLAGSAHRSAHIHSNLEMGAVSIGGSVVGGVEHALIHAGRGSFGSTNADAQFGNLTVGGDWISSSLVAGAQAGADEVFGTQDDGKFSAAFTKDVAGVFSRINSVIIGGQVVRPSNAPRRDRMRAMVATDGMARSLRCCISR